MWQGQCPWICRFARVWSGGLYTDEGVSLQTCMVDMLIMFGAFAITKWKVTWLGMPRWLKLYIWKECAWHVLACIFPALIFPSSSCWDSSLILVAYCRCKLSKSSWKPETAYYPKWLLLLLLGGSKSQFLLHLLCIHGAMHDLSINRSRVSDFPCLVERGGTSKCEHFLVTFFFGADLEGIK